MKIHPPLITGRPALRRLGPAVFTIAIAQTGVPAQAEHAVYPEKGDAHTDVQRALSKAAREHKRVLLDLVAIGAATAGL